VSASSSLLLLMFVGAAVSSTVAPFITVKGANGTFCLSYYNAECPLVRVD
jgi:hypothetical protein